MPPMQWVHENWKGGGGSPARSTTISRRPPITCIDDAVIDDDTVVAFKLGDYLGDFNMLLKGSLPLRSITAVDLARPCSSVLIGLVSIDLPLTILEHAGVRSFFGELPAAPRSGRAARHDATLIE